MRTHRLRSGSTSLIDIFQADQQPLPLEHASSSPSPDSRDVDVEGQNGGAGGGAGGGMLATSDKPSDPSSTTTPVILVANRGEIAIRIIRAIHELGFRAIAIYSYEDRLSMHRYKADESYLIAPQGKFTPVGAYLAIDEILLIARKRRASAIHPGYGFLAENSTFAAKCESYGIAFIGPTSSVIEMFGDKTLARACAIQAGLPVVPGSEIIYSLKEAKIFTDQYGFPVIIKAANGGGGRGIRIVRDAENLPQLFDRCRSEALAAFGNGACFLERYVDHGRHIEIQLLADAQGGVIHLFERDCSVQRRYQKVVEIAPAMRLPDPVRQALYADAVKIAKHVQYRNAGTAEFLVDDQNRHYFMEINPRIQVEHTVTEEITGLDLVASQIRIAFGSSLADLGLVQSAIHPRGFAIQCRITTEDATQNFRPDTGRLEVYRSSGGPGVRLDGGPGYSGAIITPHYDSLLTKVTCTGHDYEAARRRCIRALEEFRIRGVKTNIPFILNLISHPTFVEGGRVWTTFIDDTPSLLQVEESKNRGQNVLRYLGDLVVNGSRVKGQNGLPALKGPIVIPPLPDLSPGISPTDLAFPCQHGWRNILVEQGPAAFCKAIRAHPGKLVMDTTWRDAHQSLLATRVRTIDMARIAIPTSHALQGAFALECWGGATFDVCLRFLWECPWERLKTLRALVPNIPFQMLLRGSNAVGYTAYPDNVVYEFCKKAVECGVDIFRVFDSLNYEPNLKLGIDAVIEAGGVAEGAISYTGDVSDPTRTRYNLEYYLNLTDRLVADGIHILGIKDMAGLLKPAAAKLLVSSIRKRHPDLVIHVHTHDTAGTGVASMLSCYEAGADVVDVALDSMSGLTSQPSMGAILGSLRGTAHDLGISHANAQALNSYWEQMRLLYACFDAGLKSSDSGVYEHEMPGGQYTNLLFQSQHLGLGEYWNEIKKAYAAANLLCGDIVKVTPSSKVVGDLAQFMVSQKLSASDVIERAETLSFPTSVIQYFQGFLGIPPYGFAEPLRTRILASKNLTPIEARPGADMPPLDFLKLRTDLLEKWGPDITDLDVLSAALYPQVFEQYYAVRKRYGDLSVLPTERFLAPLSIGEEFSFDLDKGKTLIIKLVAIGPLVEETRRRDVFFLLNGEARMLSIEQDANGESSANGSGGGGNGGGREKADTTNPAHVAAPMSGVVVEVRVASGTTVKVGDPVAVMSAMKMETVVNATCAGVVDRLCVKVNESINAGDLICALTASKLLTKEGAIMAYAGSSDLNAKIYAAIASNMWFAYSNHSNLGGLMDVDGSSTSPSSGMSTSPFSPASVAISSSSAQPSYRAGLHTLTATCEHGKICVVDVAQDMLLCVIGGRSDPIQLLKEKASALKEYLDPRQLDMKTLS